MVGRGKIEKGSIDKMNSQLKKTIWIGLGLRIIMLILLLTVGRSIAEPYFISDDISYERLAQTYMNCAASPIDINAFRLIGASGYLQVFWPWVMCVSAFLFQNIYAGRVINIILSVLCIREIYSVSYRLSEQHRSAIIAARLFAYLPVTVMTCCFPIKDIFLTYASLVFFKLVLDIQNGERLRVSSIILCVLLLIGTYFTRGAVVELYGIFAVIYLFSRLHKKNKIGWMLLLALVTVLLAYIMSEPIISAFQIKIDNYSSYGLDNAGGISMIRITSFRDLYKLPLTYFFAMLQPIKMDLFSSGTGDSFWLSLMSTLNVSIYPVAIGSFIYIFRKKYNFLFWLSTIVIYSAVIILSVGVFRHYMFLLPLEIINYSLVRQHRDKRTTLVLLVGSMILFILILLYSLF